MVNETFIIEGKTIVAGKVFKFTSVLPLPLPLTFYFYLKKMMKLENIAYSLSLSKQKLLSPEKHNIFHSENNNIFKLKFYY